MTRPCASRTLLSSCLPWAMPAHAVWGTLDARAEPDRGPAQALFRRSQLCTLCWPALLRRPISGALSTRPQRRRRRWPGFKEVSYYHRVDALRGLSNRARRTPRFVAGVASATVANVGGRLHSGRRGTAGFRRSGPCAHTGAVHGACGSGSPNALAAGVSMDAK